MTWTARRMSGTLLLSAPFAAGLVFASDLVRRVDTALAARRDWIERRLLTVFERSLSNRDDARAATAARMLGRLRSTRAIPLLAAAIQEGAAGTSGAGGRGPSGTQATNAMLRALADIGTDESLLALEGIMNAPASTSSPAAEALSVRAAGAITYFRTKDRAPILAKLLVHGLPGVREQGIEGALRESGPQYREILTLAAPGAVARWDELHGRPESAHDRPGR